MIRNFTSRVFLEEYPELSWYTGEAITVHGDGDAERERVICALNNFDLVVRDQHKLLVGPQKDDQLTIENFDSLRNNVRIRGAGVPDRLKALELALVVHDLFKIRAVINRFKKDFNLQEEDHDTMIAKALLIKPCPFPSIASQTPKTQQLVLSILGRGISLAQLMQGECNTIMVTRILEFRIEEPTSFWMYTIFELFDISGACGHIQPVGSMVLTNSFVEIYNKLTSFFTIQDLLDDSTKFYKRYLVYRLNRLGLPTQPWFMPIARLVCALRTTTVAMAFDVVRAFHDLEYIQQAVLRAELGNLSGQTMYFMPQLLLNRVGKKTGEERIKAMTEAFAILASCYVAVGKNSVNLNNFTCDLTDLVNYLKDHNDIPEVVLNGNKIKPVEKLESSTNKRPRND
jgi:hypothetical protein